MFHKPLDTSSFDRIMMFLPLSTGCRCRISIALMMDRTEETICYYTERGMMRVLIEPL